MVAATMLLLPSFVLAQTESCSFLIDSHTVDIRDLVYSELQNPDSEFSGIMSRRTADASRNVRWIDRINNLPDDYRAFYDKYRSLVQEVLAGGSNCLSDPENDKVNAVKYGISYHIPVSSATRKIEYYFSEDVPSVRNVAMSNAIREDIEQNLRSQIDEKAWIFLPYVHMSLSYDLPEAFWISYNFMWSTYTDCTYGFLNESHRDSVEYTYTVYYSLKMNNYDVRIDEFRTPSAMSAAVTEFKGLVDDILADVPKTTRYDQIRYLNNWLTTHNAYSAAHATGEYPLIVWSPMSALRGCNDVNGPVCEGYARAFKVLCDKLGIPCVLAVGNAYGYVGATPEAHMWNEVMMNDEKWYGVDVTWNDPITGNDQDPKVSGLETEKWLLLGKNTVVSTYNGQLTFAESHPNSIINGKEQSAYWDYSCASLIADSKFDPVTGIDRINPVKDDLIYYIGGRLYFINGKKVWIK